MAKWNKNDPKGTRWCAELDIHHFYESLRPDVVLDRMRQLVKDHRVLGLVERVTRNGILIGAYCSQWFANTTLQPMDHLIRESGLRISHYIRYMDNITIYARSKRTLDKVIRLVDQWLRQHGMRLKDNWQKFRTDDRLPCALAIGTGGDTRCCASEICSGWPGSCAGITGKSGAGSEFPSPWRWACCPDWDSCGTATVCGSTSAW